MSGLAQILAGARYCSCVSIAVVDGACVGRAQAGLGFARVQRGPDGAVRSVEVSLRTPGLDARLQVQSHYASGFDDLVAFFQGLAAGWRGWQGEQVYESLEHDLRLTATHNGHVRLAVQMSLTSEPEGWSASAVLRLDPGEEMTQAADDVAALMVSAQ
jgi:hypothetical protein